ncbi:MAG: murein biosynthesis integral membrane protein MurJ [Alphaproteobacteria bacterium]|nr:murein biosynthesis integral membrane protein MurJ [Alphaproteobacteria bacterium]MDD9920298.1 murein biosynthesis integral membrane protein MurJ [Alphaproteobacteria bacterium]
MSILKSSVIVSAWTMVSRVLGFLRDVAIANKLGASAYSDAFFIALTLPNLLRRLFAEGAFNVAFVPVFSQTKENDPEAAQVFTNAVFTWLLIVLTLVTIVAELAMPALIAGMAPGFLNNPEKFDMTVMLGRITFPYLALITLTSLMGALCNSWGRFAAYAFVPSFLNIALIACLFGLPRWGYDPVIAAALGVPIGGIFQLLFMAFAFRNIPIKLKLAWPPVHPNLKTLLARFAPAALGVGVLQISFLIDTILASQLYDEAVSYLQYANRFYQLPLALIGTALATVLLPHFAKALGRGDTVQANKAFTRSLTGGMSLALAATVGLVVLAEPMLATLLKHGAFDEDASRATAWAMMAYTVGLPGYILTKITSTAFFAAGDTKTPLKTSAFSLVINIIANLTLMQFFGHVGIALATAISGYSNAAMQAFLLQKRGVFNFSFSQVKPLLTKALPISLVIAALLVGYQVVIPYEGGFLLRFLWLCGAVTLGVASFAVGGLLTGLVDKKVLKLR